MKKAVGYMYRETSSESVTSGWTFMAGDEDEDYVNNPDHWAIYEVNTVCNYDQTILPYLESPPGTAWGKALSEGANAMRARLITQADKLCQAIRHSSSAAYSLTST